MGCWAENHRGFHQERVRSAGCVYIRRDLLTYIILITYLDSIVFDWFPAHYSTTSRGTQERSSTKHTQSSHVLHDSHRDLRCLCTGLNKHCFWHHFAKVLAYVFVWFLFHLQKNIYLGPWTFLEPWLLKPCTHNHHQSSTVPKHMGPKWPVLLSWSTPLPVMYCLRLSDKWGDMGQLKQVAHAEKFRSEDLSSSVTPAFGSVCTVSPPPAFLSSCQDTTL